MRCPGPLANGRGRGLARVTALTLVQGGAAGAAAFATRGLFEALRDPDPLPATLLAVLATSGAVIAAARVAARVSGERLGQSYARDIRMALFEHAAGMPASDVAARRSGYMSLRFVGDMTAFRNWLGLGLPRLIAGAVLIPLALIVLGLLEPAFAVWTVLLVGLALATITAGGLRLRPLHRRLRARRARIAAEMSERMPLAPHLDRLGRRRTERRQLDKRIDRMVAAAVARLRLSEALKAVPDALAGLAAVAILVAGERAGASPGSIAGGLAALGLVLSPMRDLASVWNLHSAWRQAARKAEVALDRSQRGTYTETRRLPSGPAEIEIVDMPLPSGRTMSLHLAPGAVVELPARDGDGDFALRALAGLEDVPAGRIRLSGVCITRLSRGALRRGVALVGATPPILQGSLRRALTMGVTDRLADDRLEALAREAGLGPTLDRLGGLDGTVREGARNLSGAEGAAISLVRARQLTPRLVLLEDSTGSLDVQMQERIASWLSATGATVLRQAGAMRVPRAAP
ncbi:ATP-binding cassette, subfamily B/ATP-binding cassette, subfamily C, CydC [Roseivivax halotolerans]|uniref:ATP-binding cassette, subfamily B/ATP-binding cassette, subfamily C, CydC n=1 Tax=Roseivivax halotolerans TaxID=93684 RepID=A0A1I6A5R3_9RHOB|nr:ABC transporter ATP-binding protein [Roseivivax halotolerans]SFQ63963.1 ATP-binding cassette, subfamily B/ATP-binding cassette, subfamily C, CydC [Roseivivax halotolerans]